MQQLGHVSCGWGWAERIINLLIDNINARGVIPSATVAVQETPGGCMLTVIQGAQPNQGTQPGGGGGSPAKVIMAACKWTSVLVVDPATCAQSSITFLEGTGFSSDTIEWDVKDNGDGSWTLKPPSVP